MLPPFLQCPSPLLLSLSLLLLLLHCPLVAPFSALDNMPRKIASTPQQLSLIPTTPMRAEVTFSHKATFDEIGLARRIEFLKSLGISSFAIANTDKKDREAMSHWIEVLRKVGGQSATGVHICAQYSLKHHPTPKAGLREKKEDFLQTLKCAYSGANEVLLLSGCHGPEPRAWKTVDALSALYETEKAPATKIAIGYNPYYLGPRDQDRENARLLAELATLAVDRIYLQFGTDLDKLKTGIDFCQKAAATMTTAKEGSSRNDGHVSLVGSLFLPAPQRIVQQKSRPWKGVVLGPEFKSDPSGQNASALVSEIVKLYQKHEIELLWEAPGIWSQDEADTMVKILLGAVSATGEAKSVTGMFAENDVGSASDALKTNPIDSLSNHATLEDDTKPKDRNYSDSKKAQHQQEQEQHCGDSSEDPCLLIFGSHDVRVRDNHALEEAYKMHAQVLPVFLYTQEEREGDWGCPQNTAVAVCLEDALKSLQSSLESFGLPLVYCNGTTSATHRHGVGELLHLIEIVGAKAIFWNKKATPEGKARYAYWKDCLERHDPTIVCYQGQSSLLYDVEKLELKSGFQHGYFGTLMPFLKKCTKDFGPPPRPTPYFETFRLLENGKPPKSLSKLLPSSNVSRNITTTIFTNLSDLKLVEIRGCQNWDEPIRERFPMSEQTAHEEMESFVRNGMKKYEKERSRADKTGATSKLSPHFRIGTLSPNQLYWRIEDSGLPYELLKTISKHDKSVEGRSDCS